MESIMTPQSITSEPSSFRRKPDQTLCVWSGFRRNDAHGLFYLQNFLAGMIVLAFFAGTLRPALAGQELLNVSYDATRELYEDYDKVFAAAWKQKTGKTIALTLSNGGSGKQARAVINGLDADIVTLALAYDIDAIASKSKRLPPDWQSKLPHNSCPYSSTIVFLVRKGNPKNIKDWDDLVRPGVQIITPNPKSSGGARWNYMAAWGYALGAHNNNENAAKDFVAQLYRNVLVLDTGARGAMTSFAQRELGDVLLSWESEAYAAMDQLGRDKFDIVVPSVSILAETPVALVEANAARKGNLDAARAYLDGLYDKDTQELIARHHYRPADPDVAAKHAAEFPHLNLMTISDFGGWPAAQKKHFDDGGVFDQIYERH
jgi:sulfate/thiosulfate transport system substrate-binding protein